MRSAEEHIWALVDAHHEDRPACCCERCKNGRELFILPSDIRAIQADATAEKDQEIERLKAALHKIACWHDGPEVTGRFDEPASAKIAREALKGVGPSKSTS